MAAIPPRIQNEISAFLLDGVRAGDFPSAVYLVRKATQFLRAQLVKRYVSHHKFPRRRTPFTISLR
jgi:hypothetical protein